MVPLARGRSRPLAVMRTSPARRLLRPAPLNRKLAPRSVAMSRSSLGRSAAAGLSLPGHLPVAGIDRQLAPGADAAGLPAQAAIAGDGNPLVGQLEGAEAVEADVEPGIFGTFA